MYEIFERALKAGIPWENVPYIASTNELVELIKKEVQKGNYTFSFYIKQNLLTGDIASDLMDYVSQAGVQFRGVSVRNTTYFEGTTNPGTFYKIDLTINK